MGLGQAPCHCMPIAIPSDTVCLTRLQVPVEVHRDATFKELRILLGRYMDAVPENVSQQLMLKLSH